MPMKEDEKFCKYCLSNDNIESLISPCRCKGSMSLVHRDCLNNWITFSSSRHSYKCTVCNYKYKYKYMYDFDILTSMFTCISIIFTCIKGFLLALSIMMIGFGSIIVTLSCILIIGIIVGGFFVIMLPLMSLFFGYHYSNQEIKNIVKKNKVKSYIIQNYN